MKISELASDLKLTEAEFGDIEVVYWTGATAQPVDTFVGLHRSGNRYYIGSAQSIRLSTEDK